MAPGEENSSVDPQALIGKKLQITMFSSFTGYSQYVILKMVALCFWAGQSTPGANHTPLVNGLQWDSYQQPFIACGLVLLPIEPSLTPILIKVRQSNVQQKIASAHFRNNFHSIGTCIH